MVSSCEVDLAIGFEHYSKSLRDCGETFQMSRSGRQKATDRARRSVAFGLPDRIRTDDLQSRSLTRYPAEPRVDYSLCDKENEKLQLNNKSELFWLGHRDSNPGNDGVRVRCLTAWRCPTTDNIISQSSCFVNTFLKIIEKNYVFIEFVPYVLFCLTNLCFYVRIVLVLKQVDIL